MTVLRLDSFTIDPADIDDRTWINVWRWDSLANAQAAAFSLTTSFAVEYAEVLDA